VINANPSFGHGGMTPSHTHLSFGGSKIPQTNPTIGGQTPFSFRSNPSLNALDGVLNKEDKPPLIFFPFPLPPPCQF
jgi:hypothetical protein